MSDFLRLGDRTFINVDAITQVLPDPEHGGIIVEFIGGHRDWFVSTDEQKIMQAIRAHSDLHRRSPVSDLRAALRAVGKA